MKTPRNLSKAYPAIALALTVLLLVGGVYIALAANNTALVVPATGMDDYETETGYDYEDEADYNPEDYPEEQPEGEYQPEPEDEPEPPAEPEPEAEEPEPEPPVEPEPPQTEHEYGSITQGPLYWGDTYIHFALPRGDTFTMAQALELNGFTRDRVEFVQLVVSYGDGNTSMTSDPARINAAWDLFLSTRLTTARDATPWLGDAVETVSLMFIYSDSVVGVTTRGSVYILGGNPWPGPFAFAQGSSEQAFIDLYFELFHGHHGP